MKRFILTPRAKQDVTDIWDYIADDNIEAAGRVLDANWTTPWSTWQRIPVSATGERTDPIPECVGPNCNPARRSR
jgi:hypothetical protein